MDFGLITIGNFFCVVFVLCPSDIEGHNRTAECVIYIYIYIYIGHPLTRQDIFQCTGVCAALKLVNMATGRVKVPAARCNM